MLGKNTLVGAVVASVAASGPRLAQVTLTARNGIRTAEDLTLLRV
jgi:hypothetical protein